MKNLKTLIKLRKHSINEILKRISLLQQHKALLEKKLINLVREMEMEAEEFSATEYGFALDNYLVGAREQKQKYLHGVVTAEYKIQETQVVLHEEFGEMKKLEIALQNREKEEAFEEAALETKSIDDLIVMRKVEAK
jgi:hypothetical protein